MLSQAFILYFKVPLVTGLALKDSIKLKSFPLDEVKIGRKVKKCFIHKTACT